MLTIDDAGSGHFDGAVAFGFDGTLAVDGLAQCVDNAADQALANGNGNDTAGTLDGVAFLNTLVSTQDNDGDGILVQVLGHAVRTVGELDQLACHALVQAGYGGNTVTDQDDNAGLAGLHLVFVVLDLTTNYFGYFFGSQFHTVPAF